MPRLPTEEQQAIIDAYHFGYKARRAARKEIEDTHRAAMHQWEDDQEAAVTEVITQVPAGVYATSNLRALITVTEGKVIRKKLGTD